jgi:hypothetical protein
MLLENKVAREPNMENHGVTLTSSAGKPLRLRVAPDGGVNARRGLASPRGPSARIAERIEQMLRFRDSTNDECDDCH